MRLSCVQMLKSSWACLTCHVLCLPQESIENLRAKAFEAKRWIRLKLDSLGQPPVLDADSDLEAGYGVLVLVLFQSGRSCKEQTHCPCSLPVTVLLAVIVRFGALCRP